MRAIEPDRLHHQVEQLSRAADKRNSGDVFVVPWRFADEHHAPLRIAVGEHELRRGRTQHAAFERFEQRAERFQAFRAFAAPRAAMAAASGEGGAAAMLGAAMATSPLSCPLRASGGEEGRAGHWRRRRNFIREAIDRLLAEERVNPGIAVEGDQIACVFACSIHG